MPKDAPVNTGARTRFRLDPWSRVSEMQARLHRWAAADPGRRFDDLFNLVHDPATLIVAFDRVAGNHGAKTPGVDGLTVARIEQRRGPGDSWTDADCPEAGHLPGTAGEGTQDSQAGRFGKGPQVRDPGDR